MALTGFLSADAVFAASKRLLTKCIVVCLAFGVVLEGRSVCVCVYGCVVVSFACICVREDFVVWL